MLWYQSTASTALPIDGPPKVRVASIDSILETFIRTAKSSIPSRDFESVRYNL